MQTDTKRKLNAAHAAVARLLESEQWLTWHEITFMGLINTIIRLNSSK